MAVTAAQLNVIISATGAKEVITDLNQLDGQVKKAASGFDAFYESVGGGAGRALRALDGVARVMGSIAVAGGLSLIAGGAKAAWDQVNAVEQATVALRAYEKDASAVDKVLQDLIAYARSDLGVLFQRQDLFNAAQGLRMYGAETRNLTRYVEIMSRSVGLGLSTWDDLNRVIGRVGSTGRLAGDDFDYLRAAGFRLDDSMRNTNVTFDELFAAMDRGIPANALEGQSETIRGALIRLQTGIRNIGLAFLDVDSETSKFVEGGLGDRLRNAIFDARGWLDGFTDAAGRIGNGIVVAIEAVESMAAAYRSLPGWMQSAVESILKLVAAFGALRVAGSALGMIGNLAGLGGLIGGIRNLAGGFNTAAGSATTFSNAVSSLIFRINPLSLVMGGIIALGVSWVMSYGRQKKAVDDYNQSVSNLEATLESLRRQGMRSLAAQGEGLAGIINELDETSERFMDQWRDSVEIYSAEWEKIQDFQEVTLDQQRRLNDLLNEALTDPNIDIDAWMSWATSLLTGAENAEELKANVELILDTPLSDFALDASSSMDDLNDSMERVGATAADISEVFAMLPAQLDDLRIDGLGQQADDLERLAEAMERAFTPTMLPGASGEYVLLDDLDVGKLEGLAGAWERISDAVSSGDFDNARLMADIMEVLSDPTLSMDQKADEIIRISTSLAEYTTLLGEARSAMQDWLSTGDNFLDFWLKFDQLAGNVASGSFRDLVQQVRDFGDAADGLDRALYYFEQIDALGQRSSKAGAIADALFGPDGNPWDSIGPMREVFDAGLISYEQFIEAIEAGISIQESNAQTQLYLNKIRTDQLPLLAEEQKAYEAQVKALSELEPLEQRRALAMMDSGYQSQLATQYATAYAASIGEIPEEVATEMIVKAAEADPILKDLLLQFELIEEGADGEIRVNFPDGDTVQDAITELTRSIDALIETLGGIPPVRVDTSDVDPAIAKLNELAEAARNAVLAGLGNIGAGGSSARTGSRTAGSDTWGSTGVPVVTGLPATGSGGSITIDASQANAELNNLQVRLFGFAEMVTTTTLEADATQANTTLDNLAERLSGYRGLTSTTTLEADGAQANNVLDLLGQRLTGYRNLVSTTTLDANPEPANTVLNLLGERLSGYRNLTSTTTLDANSASAHEVIRLLENRLREVDGSQAVVYLHAIDFATSTINSVSRNLRDLDGRTATIYTDSITRYSSQGIRGYADGGIVREPVVLVGERGPELVSLPYGSQVFSNAETMAMLRSAVSRRDAGYVPVASQSAGRGGTTVIDKSTHTETYVALNDQQFAELLAAKDKANIVHDAMTNRHSASQYGGGRR